MGRILHKAITVIRMLRNAFFHLFHYGLAGLAKYTGPCSRLICFLCLAACLYDLVLRRRFDAILWLVTALLLWTAFRLEASLYPPVLYEIFALAAASVGLLLLGRILLAPFRRRTESTSRNTL